MEYRLKCKCAHPEYVCKNCGTALEDGYKTDISKIDDFIKSCCICNKKHTIRLKHLFKEFDKFMKTRHILTPPKGRFKKLLMSQGYEFRYGTGNQLFVYGMKLKDEIPIDTASPVKDNRHSKEMFEAILKRRKLKVSDLSE